MNSLPEKELINRIALTKVKGIGNKVAKRLLSHFKNATNIIEAKPKEFLKIEGVQVKNANKFAIGKSHLLEAKRELAFVQKKGLEMIFYTDESYPKRLKFCDDGPILLYSKGNIDFNTSHVISIIGTRDCTRIGKQICEKIIEELKPLSPLIISGMAFGIDICAHKAAIKNDLQTVAVLAHGLDTFYPAEHRKTGVTMCENGGYISEFSSGVIPDRTNFPTRNRVVAGLSDLTLVIESNITGGSIITANLAFGYNRDVAAIPGRPTDLKSKGTNYLIQTNKAALVNNAEDIKHLWAGTVLHKQQQNNNLYLLI